MLPKDVDIKTEIVSIANIYKEIQNNTITPLPQTLTELSDSEYSDLICSIMLRIPLSDIYAYYDKDTIKLVTGNQKVFAIYLFMSDEFAYQDNDINGYFPNLHGLKYSEFPLMYQRRIKESYIHMHIIRDGTPDDVKADLIRRFKFS